MAVGDRQSLAWPPEQDVPVTTLHVLTVPGADLTRDRLVAEMQADTSVCLHPDPLRLGVLQNFAGALECADGLAQTWSLIVQDDAILIGGWKTELSAALHYSPSPILGLTYFGSYGLQLAARGVPYGLAKNAVWGGAAAYHRAVLPGLLAVARFALEIGWNRNSDDGAVCAFNHIRGGDSALAARAVFGQSPVRSLLGHSNRASCFPHLTIANYGPKWSTRPASARLGTRSRPADVMQLVDAWGDR